MTCRGSGLGPAAVVVFLLYDDTRFLWGTNIMVSGGQISIDKTWTRRVMIVQKKEKKKKVEISSKSECVEGKRTAEKWTDQLRMEEKENPET